MPSTWKPGMKIDHRLQPGWGVGEILGVSEDGRLLKARFSGRPEGPMVLSSRDQAIVRHRFPVGGQVLVRGKGRVAIVVGHAASSAGFHRYQVETGQGQRVLDERELEAPAPEPGPLAALRAGRWDPPEAFALRQEAVTLDLQRRGDALGALFASRVMVKPYQVSVVQRVLSARAPRFVLADEVGLGKTIEAGMVLSALAQSGLGRRMLVVAPAHLTLQWLAELYRKLNLAFTLLDADRIDAERQIDPRSPFLRFDRILTSLELLSRSDDAVEVLTSPEGRLDLAVFDEAHHLAGAKAFSVAERLARASWGVLFLTATPLALDPEEYFHLLQLLEPSAARDPQDFAARLARQGEVAALARALLTTAPDAGARAEALAARFPQDARLAAAVEAWERQGRDIERERLLDHLAEGYTLSQRLLRNRRAAVGGFPSRRLRVHEVTPSDEERAFLDQARAAIASAQAKGAVQAALLRRLESSPAAAAQALAGTRVPSLSALVPRARALEGPDHDAKYRTFRALLRAIPAEEKVLVFSEARETLAMLAAQIERDGFASTQYHGDLTPLERDRQVARFRDPEGPRLLLSTELGGEGRNFQFCRHLVHYDLPWSPAAVEQRIGRIDRVGQLRDMDIHILRMEGTIGAAVADLFTQAIGVFEEPAGGLDPVLGGVEDAIAALAPAGDAAAWARYREELTERVAKARAEIRENFDPLLDRRSFDREAVAALVERGARRLGIEEDVPEVDATELEEGLQLLSRELDERLEEVVTRLAAQVGIQVDTDEHVEAFECAFTLGREMSVEALPGLHVPDEPETLLGSFWRDTAVEREEIESFATGHRLVEALIGLARDGQAGRSTFRRLHAGRRGLGFQLRYLWQLPEPEDLAAGARVPSRYAARLLPRAVLDVAVTVDGAGCATSREDLLELLRDPDLASEPVRPDEVPLDGLARSLEAAVAHASERAGAALAEDAAQALARLDQDREAAEAHRALRLARCEGAERVGLLAEQEEERAFFDAVAEALRAARVELDSAAGFVLE